MMRLIGVEGGPPSAGGVTWGAAAIEDGDWLVNGVTRTPIAEAERLAAEKMLTLFETPAPIRDSIATAAPNRIVALAIAAGADDVVPPSRAITMFPARLSDGGRAYALLGVEFARYAHEATEYYEQAALDEDDEVRRRFLAERAVLFDAHSAVGHLLLACMAEDPRRALAVRLAAIRPGLGR